MLEINVNLIWVLINLIILFILFKKFMLGRIMRVIERRDKLMKDQIAKANAANEKARKLKSKYEKTISGAKEESQKIVEAARQRAELEYKQIIQEAEERARRLVESTTEGLEQERAKAMQDAQNEIAGLAIAAAAKIIGETSGKLSDNELYDEFLTKAGEQHDTNSH